MKSCYIVAAAELAPERLRPEPGDLLIAADAGLLHLERLGLAPDLALGDFDSLGYVPEAPQVEVCPVRKDDTDTMTGLRLGLGRGCREFVIVGALGGRLDHTVANLQALCWLCTQGARGSHPLGGQPRLGGQGRRARAAPHGGMVSVGLRRRGM